MTAVVVPLVCASRDEASVCARRLSGLEVLLGLFLVPAPSVVGVGQHPLSDGPSTETESES